MANQQTSAVRQGEDWLVNGHKVWTSLGHFAKWMILITRTSKEHKYDGLTYFVCPIEGHPGVSVRPLIKITGETGFNEVLFEDVVIPDSMRLWDIETGQKLYKDVFRRDLGSLTDAYTEVARRLGVMPKQATHMAKPKLIN